MELASYTSYIFGYKCFYKRDRGVPTDYEVRVSRIGGSLRVTIPAELTKAFGVMAGETLLASLEAKGILFRRLDSKVSVEKVHCPKCGKKLTSEDLTRGSAGGILLACPFCLCHAQIEKFDGL